MHRIMSRFQSQQKGRAGLVATCSLLLGLLWPFAAHAQQVNDLTQMDSANVKKPEASPRSVPNLRAEDRKKYQALVSGMQGKNGDEILKAMQADNAAKMEKMPPERRKQIEEYRKKFQVELKAAEANPQNKTIDATMDAFHRHLLGLDRGDAKTMTVQQKTYFEHRQAQIKQKYFNSERSEKNRRMLEESNAYLKATLDRQAEYAKNFESAAFKTDQTRASPLPMDALRSNWLVRRMAAADPATLMPRTSALPAANVPVLRAQLDDLSRQLRSDKAMSVSERYGADARTISEAEGKSYLQNLPRNGNPVAANSNPPAVTTAGGNKPQAETPARKISSIPGL